MTTPSADLLRLDEATLLALLGLRRGDPLGDTLVVDGALPHHEGGLLLSLRAREGRQQAGLQVRVRDDAQPAWRRTRHLDVITQVPPELDEARVLRLLEPLIDRLEAADGPATQVVDPHVAGAPPPPALRPHLAPHERDEAPSLFDFGRVFVLDLASDCGQGCHFCSTRAKWSPRTRFAAAERLRLQTRLRAARDAGYATLRLSGLDPLTHPDVLPLLRAAIDMGFGHVHIYSPSTRYAEPAFLDALLACLGDTPTTLHIPVYGPNAAVHDHITATPGSFERVTSGLDALARRGWLDRVLLLTVVTRSNVDHLGALRGLLSNWPAPVHVFLPFPATRDPRDRFFDVAVSHTEMVGPMTAAEPPLGLSALLPCVRFRHERDTGAPALSRGGHRAVAALDGNLFELADYRRADDGPEGNTFTIPTTACPVAADCALAGRCPRAVYTAYAECFGLGELVAVSAGELDALSRPRAAAPPRS